MSKKQPVFVPADEASEVASTPPETADRSALGREMKIGLGVILVLLVVLGVVLVRKLSGPGDVAATAETSPSEATAEAGQPDAGPLVTLPSQPTVMTATADTSVQPASGTLDRWATASDVSQMETTAAPAPAPPTFMPKPVEAEPSPHFAGYGTQETASEPAALPTPTDGYASAASSDPFLRQPAIPTAQSEAAPAEPAGQTPANQAAGGSLAPAWKAPLSSAATGEANPLRTQLLPQASGAAAEPPALPETSLMPAASQPTAPAPEPAAEVAAPSPLPTYESGYSRSTYRESDPLPTATMPVASPRPIAVSEPAQSVVPGNDGTYTIQPGDNYWLISERLYGTGAYFQALAEHNRKKFPQENNLVVGETIAAPGAEELTAEYPALCPKPGHRDAAQQRARIVSTSTRLGGGKAYVVQEGDSLFDIAKFELGKASRWVEIYELNRDVLGKQFDYLTPGMQLVLPQDRPAGTLTQRTDQIYRR